MKQKIYAKKYPNDTIDRCRLLTLLFLVLFVAGLRSQIAPGVYMAGVNTAGGPVQHEIKVTDDYLAYTEYQTSPATFIRAFGGKYTLQNGRLHLDMEFNSNYEEDSIKTLDLPVRIENNKLLWGRPELEFSPVDGSEQPLDGLWLFATRGPDTGQERRGEENSRKTLKFLIDGRFQWIAYDTADMRFSGTGGGTYKAQNGTYAEHIEYFSRDSSRVGATLDFEFELRGDDWHHTGKNSRGEPMYEIWARRKSVN